MDVMGPVLKGLGVLLASVLALVLWGLLSVPVMLVSREIGGWMFLVGAVGIVALGVWIAHRAWERARALPRTLRVLRPDGALPGERTA